ncbi:ABC transporter ATP-binding protein [Gynuella sunshinyii]|uniref:ABC-type dipeptide/oligopeptide/nickel transport system, ATPase component n=1 Tax=Gynuella sunshinyii YC6258 TaxID=1445510 RepID=A0A0C5VQE5_9GAMM|nr:ABC transporter ATP-binding protein [Gynuella sunshinyii]AJQ96486.1 ABC-type dipeptide/oligopeptide/nickel transport system, ATPase component [Gynuella sunshinyii YC6258]
MADDVLISTKDLSVEFKVSAGWLWQRTLKAVNEVSLTIRQGSIVGLVGESGSGKSTLGRALLCLEPICAGHVDFDGLDLEQATQADIRHLRQQTALIFQDPFSALNPKMTIGDAIAEVLTVHRKRPTEHIPDRVVELLQLTGLGAEHAKRYPHQLSGGQCQRAVIARALALEPRLIVADECVAALDVSIQAQIINLLLELNRKMGLTILFIAHDLSIVRHLCDRVAVMYLGRIVEEGTVESVFSSPRHPYTEALLQAVPDINPDNPLPDNPLNGEPPSPLELPPGCAFHARCPYAQETCRHGEAPEQHQENDHSFACLRPWMQVS